MHKWFAATVCSTLLIVTTGTPPPLNNAQRITSTSATLETRTPPALKNSPSVLTSIQQKLTLLETILKVIALLLGGVFFLWKVLTGWLNLNLSVEIATTRVLHDETWDLLGVQVTLSKGTTDTLWVRDVQVRVEEEGAIETQAQIAKIDELAKLLISDPDNIDWKAKKSKKLTFTPGEKVHFARAFHVHRRAVANVQCAVAGTRIFWWDTYQWRASAVALPLSPGSSADSAAAQKKAG